MDIVPTGGRQGMEFALKIKQFSNNMIHSRMYMSPKFARRKLLDGSFIDFSIDKIKPDEWRPHGYRYRLAWIWDDECLVLFDNHHGKSDHFHIGEFEFPYEFISINQLIEDFDDLVKKLGVAM